MDAQRGLCVTDARGITRNDHADWVTPLQSPLGAALIKHHGVDTQDPASWLFLENGQPHCTLDAVIRLGARLSGAWRGYTALGVISKPLRDWLYGFVARNRMKFMGKASFCDLSTPEVQARLLL